MNRLAQRLGAALLGAWIWGLFWTLQAAFTMAWPLSTASLIFPALLGALIGAGLGLSGLTGSTLVLPDLPLQFLGAAVAGFGLRIACETLGLAAPGILIWVALFSGAWAAAEGLKFFRRSRRK